MTEDSLAALRRGLDAVARKLDVTMSDEITRWLHAIFTLERERPWWLLSPDAWMDLEQHLEATNQRWLRRPVPGAVLIGRGDGLHVIPYDARRRLAAAPIRVSHDELVPMVEQSDWVDETVEDAPAQWVEHSKFGVGEVLEVLEGGRVRVSFQDRTRTMLADRLTPATPPDHLPLDEPSPPPSQAVEVSHPLINGYREGQCLAVYAELVSSQRADAVARAVAREMMQRVRANVDILAQRWRTLGGFELAVYRGPDEESREALKQIEAKHPLPVTLRAFYEELGFLDFVEPPPKDSRWPATVELDPLQVCGLEAEPQGHRLELFADPSTKANLAGVGATYTLIDGEEAFDAELWFEDAPFTVGGGSLVPYLRTVILEGGGIGPCSIEHAERSLLRALTEDLVVF